MYKKQGNTSTPRRPRRSEQYAESSLTEVPQKVLGVLSPELLAIASHPAIVGSSFIPSGCWQRVCETRLFGLYDQPGTESCKQSPHETTRYLAALLSVDVAVLTAMCLFHLPRVTVFSTTEQVSGVFVDLDHATCDVGRHIFTRMLAAYHALIACVTCAMSFKARKAGSQCEDSIPIP